MEGPSRLRDRCYDAIGFWGVSHANYSGLTAGKERVGSRQTGFTGRCLKIDVQDAAS
jgi:hypothetical protein